MPAPSQFRLGDNTLADLDALAASNGGTRTTAVKEAIATMRPAVEEAGRENADALTLEEWTLLGHSQIGADDLEDINPDEGAPARDWSVRIAQELHGLHEGRELLLPSHHEEQKAARKLARKISGWGPIRGYALFAALRYFWRHPDAGIAACAAPEVWMTPTAK